jgi:hypothetical protein
VRRSAVALRRREAMMAMAGALAPISAWCQESKQELTKPYGWVEETMDGRKVYVRGQGGRTLVLRKKSDETAAPAKRCAAPDPLRMKSGYGSMAAILEKEWLCSRQSKKLAGATVPRVPSESCRSQSMSRRSGSG